MDMASLGTPADPFATDAMDQASLAAAARVQPGINTDINENDDGFPASRLASSEETAAVENPSLLRLPILGSRTIAQHQRILLILLGVSVLVLAVVAYRALNQADTVAQQVAATGQSLMQSQRLAKSVSQALVKTRLRTLFKKARVGGEMAVAPLR